MAKLPRVSVLALWLAVSGCGGSGDASADGEEVAAAREAIMETIDGFEAAWLAGDSVESARFFTADAVNMRPGVESDVGRGAILSAFGEFLGASTVTAVEFTTEQLDVLGDVAYELGTFEQRYTGADGEEVTHRARYAALWRREITGTWRYHRFLFNDLPAG